MPQHAPVSGTIHARSSCSRRVRVPMVDRLDRCWLCRHPFGTLHLSRLALRPVLPRLRGAVHRRRSPLATRLAAGLEGGLFRHLPAWALSCRSLVGGGARCAGGAVGHHRGAATAVDGCGRGQPAWRTPVAAAETRAGARLPRHRHRHLAEADGHRSRQSRPDGGAARRQPARHGLGDLWHGLPEAAPAGR